MSWIVILLLVFILLAIIGGVSIIQAIVVLAGLAFMWVLTLAATDSAWIATGVTAVFVVVIGFIARHELRAEARALPASKSCPFCKEEIKYMATVCKHCSKELPSVQTRHRTPIPKQSGSSAKSIFFVVVFIGLLISYIGYKAHWF